MRRHIVAAGELHGDAGVDAGQCMQTDLVVDRIIRRRDELEDKPEAPRHRVQIFRNAHVVLPYSETVGRSVRESTRRRGAGRRAAGLRPLAFGRRALGARATKSMVGSLIMVVSSFSGLER